MTENLNGQSEGHEFLVRGHVQVGACNVAKLGKLGRKHDKLRSTLLYLHCYNVFVNRHALLQHRVNTIKHKGFLKNMEAKLWACLLLIW